jgi:hypothetical protein
VKATSNQKSKRNRKRKNEKNKSPTYVSHVGDSFSTSANHVEYQHPIIASHTGDSFVASTSYVIDQKPTSASHVGEFSTTSMIHVEEKQPAIASHAEGIDSIEKPIRIGCNPKFPCNICKVDQLTHLCPGLLEARRLWSMSASSSDFESFEVSS